MTDASTPTPRPWWRDRRLWLLVGITVGLRLLVAGLWPEERCIRDECMYLFTARRMVDGQGMTPTNGWIWAPAYVFLLAVHDWISMGNGGVICITQALFSGGAAVAMQRLGRRVAGDRAAWVAAWMYAVHPTFVFFSARMWSETIYSALLLFALLGIYRTREGGGPGRAALPGVLVGLCVLLRGVATYMLPIFGLALVWGRFRERGAWVRTGVLVVTAVAVVSPYSLYASHKFGVRIISDRTMGQMMWLGNNDFEPVTFDYGNGLLDHRSYNRHTAQGRGHCAPKDEPVARDLCETENGIRWIREHPVEFLSRIPLRLAQLFNPNSFLTRHLRWRRWRGLPDAVDEALCWLVVVFSGLTVLGGALGAWSRRADLYLLLVGLVTAYHLAAVAALAGLTRYRVPLDTLWLVLAGAFLAAPRHSVRRLFGSPWRTLGALFTLLVLGGLMAWYLPAGFPQWNGW